MPGIRESPEGPGCKEDEIEDFSGGDTISRVHSPDRLDVEPREPRRSSCLRQVGEHVARRHGRNCSHAASSKLSASTSEAGPGA